MENHETHENVDLPSTHGSDTKKIIQSIWGAALLVSCIVLIAPLIHGNQSPANLGQAAAREALQDNQPTQQAEIVLDENDLMRGAEKPRITLVEFSDYDCPFCTRIHPTLQQIVDTYPDDVAWTYRHFPLDTLHPQARGKAITAECIAQIAGAEAFWAYTDLQFSGGQPTNEAILGLIGENSAEFTSCVANQDTASLVEADIASGLAAGVSGTPHIVAILDSGEQITINGAQPYEVFDQLVQAVLNS